MPWGAWKGQVFAVSEGAVETSEAIEAVIEELGELKGFTAEPKLVWAAEMRYSQGKSALVRRTSQKIRLAIELAEGLKAGYCIVSVHAQGGDVAARGSARGVELFSNALGKRVKMVSHQDSRGATDYALWLRYAVDFAVISKMVEEHGHDYVRSNDPERYAFWVRVMKDKNEGQ